MNKDRLENKIEKWYESKVAFLLSILVPTTIILGFIYDMRTDIAVTKNDIAQIKKLLETNDNKAVARDDVDNKLNDRLTVIETKLEIRRN